MNNKELEKIWISKTLKGDIEKEVRNVSRSKAIPLQYVPKEKLNDIAKSKDHEGIVAQLSVINYLNIDEVIPFVFEQGSSPAFIVLDGVVDVRNVGAIIRSAVWFDFHSIILGMKKSARLNSVAYRTSAGAINDIAICREPSITKAIEYLKNSGVQIVIADAASEKTMEIVDLSGPVALVLGSEEKGPSKEVLALADYQVAVPGSQKVESLNVSVAAAVLMYDLYKIRNTNND